MAQCGPNMKLSVREGFHYHALLYHGWLNTGQLRHDYKTNIGHQEIPDMQCLRDRMDVRYTLG